MMKLLVLMGRNITLLFRSKITSLILLLGPLLLIFLVGTAFSSTGVSDIKIACYSDQYSSLADSIVMSLQSENYKVIKVNDAASCMSGIKVEEYHICVIFPPGLSVDNFATKNLDIYVDDSRKNLASLITSTINDKISGTSNQLSLDMTNNIINVLLSSKNTVFSQLTALEGLLTSNSQVKSSATAAKENLGLMNFTAGANAALFSTVSGQLSSLASSKNLSSSDISSINTNIATLEADYNALNAKLTNAATTTSSLLASFEAVTSSVDSASTQITEIRNGLTGINANIDSIAVTNAASIANPISTTMHPITEQKTNLNYLFPTLLLIVVMFVSLLLSSLVVIREKISSSYFRNFITPTSDFLFVFSTFLTNLLIVFVQLIIIFSVSWIFFKEQIFTILPLTALAVLALSTMFILLGMVIGNVSGSEEGSTLASICLGCIFLIFSNAILPLESIPIKIRTYVEFNPYVLGDNILRKVVLFSANLQEIQEGLYIVAGIIAGLVVILAIAHRLSKNRVL
ncbi:ABC transporter permease [Candidatus Woesearchaeota archaeon]|nr:ABC transporter permease [Candidatus Woesearchaeota archaeon]